MIKTFEPTPSYLLIRMRTDTPAYRTYEVVASGDNGAITRGDIIMVDETVARRNVDVNGELLALVHIVTVLGQVTEG